MIVDRPVSDYPDLHRDFGWALGIHRAPAGYQHHWLVVTRGATFGAWTRAEARSIWWHSEDYQWPLAPQASREEGQDG
jgi:hypothetical protein